MAVPVGLHPIAADFVRLQIDVMKRIHIPLLLLGLVLLYGCISVTEKRHSIPTTTTTTTQSSSYNPINNSTSTTRTTRLGAY